MRLTLQVWRQRNVADPGRFETYEARDISPDMSFLEMLDVVNEDLIIRGEDPIAFDYDCREGICGQCGLMINGVAHGPERATTTCQLHMRKFSDGETIIIEPWRARPVPFGRYGFLPPPRTSPRVFVSCVPWRAAASWATTTWCISGTLAVTSKTWSGSSTVPPFLPSGDRTSTELTAHHPSPPS